MKLGTRKSTVVLTSKGFQVAGYEIGRGEIFNRLCFDLNDAVMCARKWNNGRKRPNVGRG